MGRRSTPLAEGWGKAERIDVKGLVWGSLLGPETFPSRRGPTSEGTGSLLTPAYHPLPISVSLPSEDSQTKSFT